ncbi:MAG: thioredoxin family protein [bacterium]
MSSIKLFWKQNCPKCPAAKQVYHDLVSEGFETNEYDLNTADGLAEGAYHGVLSTPTLLVIDENDRELLQWRGDVPTFAEIKAVLMNNDIKPRRHC